MSGGGDGEPRRLAASVGSCWRIAPLEFAQLRPRLQAELLDEPAGARPGMRRGRRSAVRLWYRASISPATSRSRTGCSAGAAPARAQAPRRGPSRSSASIRSSSAASRASSRRLHLVLRERLVGKVGQGGPRHNASPAASSRAAPAASPAPAAAAGVYHQALELLDIEFARRARAGRNPPPAATAGRGRRAYATGTDRRQAIRRRWAAGTRPTARQSAGPGTPPCWHAAAKTPAAPAAWGHPSRPGSR